LRQALQVIYQALLNPVNPDFLANQYAIDWNKITEKKAKMAAEKQAALNSQFGGGGKQ